jgi:uncharacterized membrane protein HdeD (DUF308 family)
VLFGVFAFIWPGITLTALAIVWGAYALVDGVLALIAAFRVRDRGKPFWALLVVGIGLAPLGPGRNLRGSLAVVV